MSSLLEEAIVDAKALKEAALKNAEDAVLEKYSGEVKNALSTLLEQDEFGLGESEAPDADSSFTDDVPFAFQTEELDAPPADELIEIDFDQLKARIEEEEAEGEDILGSELTDATAMAPDLGAPPAIAPAAPDASPALALEEDGPITNVELEDDAEEDTASIATGKYVGQSVGAPEAPPNRREDLDEDLPLTEDQLAELIEELVVDMNPRPQGWASVGSADNSVIQANDDAMAAAQEAHLDEDEEGEEQLGTLDVVPDTTLYETRINKLTESHKELRTLLLESKVQLTKLNLDNAKLVYQNKALSSASLNERQKTKIVEAVQLAQSVEEAQVLFETIQNAVGVSHASRPQTLREAVERPTSLLLNSKRNNDEATKDPKLDRMLRLAGLNK